MEDSLIQYTQDEKYFTLKSFYVFNYSIDRVWAIISNPGKLLNILSDWVDKIEYFEEKKQIELDPNKPTKFKKGAKLNFRWKSLFNCKMDAADILETDFYKMLELDTIAIYPISIKYKLFYNLYWNAVEENTLLIHEIVCEVNNMMFKNDQEENRKERLIMYKKIDDILFNDKNYLHQEESIFLDIEIEELWKIIIDWRIFKEYVQQICLDVYYGGHPCKIGTEIQIINYGEKKLSTNLRVKECVCSQIPKFNIKDHYDCNNSRLNNKTTNNIDNLFSQINENEITNKEFQNKLAFKDDEVYGKYNLSTHANSKLNLNDKIDKKSHDRDSSLNKNLIKENYLKKYETFKMNDTEFSSINDEVIYQSSNDKMFKEYVEYRHVLEYFKISSKSCSKCPYKFLIFKFTKLCENKTQLIFRHEFKHPVKPEMIASLRKEKKRILTDLKNSINNKKKADHVYKN